MLQIIFYILFSAAAFSAESTIGLPKITEIAPIMVEANATFETLSEDLILPQKKVSLIDLNSNQNANLLQPLNQQLSYPSTNYGYPGGGLGVSLGGRSLEDTQVSALGVPLSLPQGGGASLSMFPAFLWSGFSISSSPSQAGFTPQAASGNLELKLWTREVLLGKRTQDSFRTEVGGNANREMQSFSMGTQYENTAVKVGGEAGKQQGPAGSLSHRIMRDPKHHLAFHILGSDLKSSTPGSLLFPSPNAKQKTWRIIPVLESHQDLDDALTLETTVFADLHRLEYTDPSSINSDTRTYQYGIENALLIEDYVLGLSARYVRLDSSYFPNHDEWPIHASFSRDFQLNSDLIFSSLVSADYVQLVGAGLGAKVGLRQKLNFEHSLFGELRTLPKFPSLISRYYQSGTQFYGYPDLKPEQVSFAILGHEFENKNKIKSISSLKAEQRQRVQVLKGATMDNAGTAYLFSLSQEVELPLFQWLVLKNTALVTLSRVQSLGISYPDLPRYSDRMVLGFKPAKKTEVNAFAQFVGDSQSVGPKPHAGYALYDLSVHREVDFIFPQLQLSAGVENVFDRRAEVVLNYPLPGRIVHFSMMGRF